MGVNSGEIGSAACGSRTAASALGLGAPSGTSPALSVSPVASPGAPASPGAAPSAAPSSPAGVSHVELGGIDTLSVKGLVTDLLKMATTNEVIHDKTHGGLPADPAKEAQEPNQCSPGPAKKSPCGGEGQEPFGVWADFHHHMCNMLQ